MEIIDLTDKYHEQYFCCLETWSDEMKEAGDHKRIWFDEMIEKGLRVKLAVEDDTACGMIQYIPIEYSRALGVDLCFIDCIWVHGYRKGIGNYQKRGIGKALLRAAEDDAASMNMMGMAAWGLSMPFWMKASWFRKQGYIKVDSDGMMVLLWKPFKKDASPPQWIRQRKEPESVEGKVTVTSFINGWCQIQSIVNERARRASEEFGELVEFREIVTSDPSVLGEWGISDGLYIDGKQVRTGPPPSYDKIRRKIAKRVKKLQGAV
jgi:GNAT superfamily N-acetyltransferase